MRLSQLGADEPYRGYLFIKDAAVRTSKNGNQFIKLVLSDQDFKETTGFLWNASEDDIKNFKQGVLVGVLGKGKIFNDAIQLDIQKIRLTNEGDIVSIRDFIETAPEEPEDMYDEILNTINNFSNEEIKFVTKTAFEDRSEELMYFPAAKSIHHAMKGGLLYHTISMLRLAKELASLYPFINEDLLYAGVILHDLGKVDEMISDANGTISDYTAKGKLLGHITSEISDIEKICRDNNISDETALLLEHMILSHHYEPEYGSPVKPMFPEAELLHHIDVIDARMNTMRKIQKDLVPGTFSERQGKLDGISIYKPTFQED